MPFHPCRCVPKEKKKEILGKKEREKPYTLLEI